MAEATIILLLYAIYLQVYEHMHSGHSPTERIYAIDDDAADKDDCFSVGPILVFHSFFFC